MHPTSRPGSAILLLALLASGCSQRPTSSEQTCQQVFATRDSITAASRDGQYAFIDGYYGLRSDRLSARLASQANTPTQQRLWLERLAENDIEASQIELSNLPVSQRGGIATPALQQRLQACRSAQIEQLLAEPQALEQVRQRSRIKDDYSDWARTLGLYPLLKPAYRAGIAQWQSEAQAQDAPLDSSQWLSYRPINVPAMTIQPLTMDELGLPQPNPSQLAALFARHAPRINVQHLSRADRIGQPTFDRQGRRQFKLQPKVYQSTGWSLLDGRWHLQLVYQFWFSQRPKTRTLDMLGGDLDGLIWRVTLNDQGSAMLYDSIHPCGCWQSFYLPQRSPLVFKQPTDEESRPHTRIATDNSKAVTLWLNAGQHSLVWVDQRHSAFPAITYQRVDINQLRQLRHPSGTKSLYSTDGLVTGSERLERWLLWPSGVRSAGSMRQWGRHATAFIGRAHFDDPELLNRYFDSQP